MGWCDLWALCLGWLKDMQGQGPVGTICADGGGVKSGGDGSLVTVAWLKAAAWTRFLWAKRQ